MLVPMKNKWIVCFLVMVLCGVQSVWAAYSLVMTNGYGDVYRMNLLRDRVNYQAYRGVCSYRGFSLSGCSTTGEVVMLRIKATPSVPEHFSIMSTSMRWGTTMYVLNDAFRWLNSSVMAGYENWYPFDMSCSVAMYINSGGFGRKMNEAEPVKAGPYLEVAQEDPSDPAFARSLLEEPLPKSFPKNAFSLVMTNGYGDVYRMNLLRNRESYQAYRGSCSYRGFSLSGCSTTGEVVMLRIMGTATMPEYFSLVSTSLRWGTTMYFLNDVFRWLNSTTMAGYENWYPFDMSCSVAMYINSGGFGRRAEPRLAVEKNPYQAPGGTNVIGALIPLTGDLASKGASRLAAAQIAFSEITNTPGMPPFQLLVEDTGTDLHVALEKLQQFYTQGVQVVIGPASSAEAEGLLEFANEHGMLLLASGPTAIPLAITNDHLMRMTMDDSYQAQRLAGQIMSDGITNLALLTRTDLYGEGLRNAFLQEYGDLGGHVFMTGYCPRVAEWLPEVVSNINNAVSAQLSLTGSDSLGVLVVVFDEGQVLLQEAAAFPNLMSARWYGADGLAGDMELMTNAAALGAARKTQLACSQPAGFTNAMYATVGAAIATATGSAPRSYSLHTYDSLWLAALALRDTGGTGTVAEVRQAIRTTAAGYAGATGPITFNAADDRADGDYAFWKVASSNVWDNIATALPDAPQARAASGIGSRGFTAAWSSCAGASQYWLDVALDAGFTSFLPGYSNAAMGNARSGMLTNLEPGQVYYYRVRAESDAGAGEYSETMSIRTAGRRGMSWWLLLFD